MDKENVTYMRTHTQKWNIIHVKKEMKSCHLLQHGWFSRALF